MSQGKEASYKTEADECFMRFIEAASRQSEAAKSLKVAIDRFFGQLSKDQQLGVIEYANALHRSK